MARKPSAPLRSLPARLLIVDDHELARSSLRLLLSGEPDLAIIGEARNGQEALELCPSLHPEPVLIDLRMPIVDGITATRLIRQACPAINVLLLTFSASPEHLDEIQQAGAAGYLLQGSNPAGAGDRDSASLGRQVALRLSRSCALCLSVTWQMSVGRRSSYTDRCTSMSTTATRSCPMGKGTVCANRVPPQQK
jgi:DNA-binding NarL/FixJ family response regulator